MRDARAAALAEQRLERVSRAQLNTLGLSDAAMAVSDAAIAHRLGHGRLVIVEDGVLPVAPVLERDRWGRWMGATLTARGAGPRRRRSSRCAPPTARCRG